MIENTYKIVEKSGIHARPASVLVKTASEIGDDVSLEYKEKSVNMQSIMGIMSLAVPEGAKVKVLISGSTETESMKQVEAILKAEGLIK